MTPLASGRQVIGVNMGLERPVDGEAGMLDVVEDAIGSVGAGAPRGDIEAEHGIDDGSAATGPVRDDVGHRVGLGIEKRLYARMVHADSPVPQHM